MDRPRVLILCTGNSCRSQMAEGLLRQLSPGELDVYSAGTDPKPIHPLAIRVLEELGIDMSEQRSKGLREFLGRMMFTYLIVVCSDADRSCPASFPGSPQRLHWPFEDPAAFAGSDEEKLVKFREVRDQIGDRLKQWLAERSRHSEGPV